MKTPLWVTACSSGRISYLFDSVLARRSILILFCLGFSVYGSESLVPAAINHCHLAVVGAGEPINDPLKLPFLPWVRLKSVDEVAAKVALANNFYVDTRDLPISADNMFSVYRRGGKLYQHFDRLDLETGQLETHRWEFPAFRGVNGMAEVKATLEKSSLISKMRRTLYPHRLPHPTQKRTVITDEAKPAYSIRINHDVDHFISQCAKSERLLQNTTTKEKIRDLNNHTVLTTATWLSLEVQSALGDMVRRGAGYSLGVYTTEHHPHEIALNGRGGKLVAGAIGIVVDGVYTGISLFMDRSHAPDKKNDMFYDGAGRLAFFAELDFLEGLGVKWIDSVTVNQAARDFGGRFYTREEFHQMMAENHKAPIPLVIPPDGRFSLRFNRWEKATPTTAMMP